MANWYDDAWIYDEAFAFDTAPEVRFLHAIFRREGVPEGGRVLEPMAGSARLLPGLRELGYRVFGFDLSMAMLRLAKTRGRASSVFRADAGRFEVARSFDAAHCLIDSFRYLQATEAPHEFLRSMARALKPRAPFVLGLELWSDGSSTPESWTVKNGSRSVHVTIQSHGDAGPGLQWMDVEVRIRDQGEERLVRSRAKQRIWTPHAFLTFVDSLEEFEVASLHLRDHDPSHVLEAIPRSGGPLIAVLRRTP